MKCWVKQQTNQRFFRQKKDIEAILTLVTEQVDKGVTFERFQETLKNYVLKSLENGEDIVTLVMKLKDHTLDL